MAETKSKKSAGQITVTFLVHEEEGQYVARCRELGTTSCGDTPDEAFRNIQDAVLLHLSTLEELGERAAFLKKRSIQIQPLIGAKPARSEHTSLRIQNRPQIHVPAMRIPADSYIQRHAFPL